MEFIDFVRLLMVIVCGPADLFFTFIFGFASEVLKMLCVSMLVITIGKILGFYERKVYYIIQLLVYLWFLLYIIYVSESLAGTEAELDFFEWVSLILSFLAPLCIFVVIFLLKNYCRKHLPIDLYYIVMIIYALVVFLWFFFKPTYVNFTMFALYWSLLLLLVYVSSQVCKGIISVMDDKFWERIVMVLKIMGLIVIFTIVKLFIIPLNPETILENWHIGLIGVCLFSGLSVFFFETIYKKYFVALALGSQALIFADIGDFVGVLTTALGLILFLIISFLVLVLIFFLYERAKVIAMAFLLSIMFSVSFLFIIVLNDEKLIENWAIGLSFGIFFVILYLLPNGKFFVLAKRLHFLMIIFWFSIFIIDFTDFINTIVVIYT